MSTEPTTNTDLDAAQQFVASLEAKLLTQQAEYRRLSDEHAGCQARIRELHARVHAENQDTAEMRAYATAKGNETAKLHLEIEGLRKDLADAQVRIRDLEIMLP